MMQRFWSVLAVFAGKHAGLISGVALVLTIVLGFGITRLDFATGQDSYLNKDDQVYIDNVAYQELFGGQAMLTVITMHDGHTVDELFTAEARAQFERFHDALVDTGSFHGVITPLTILEFADALVQSEGGDPTASIAGGALQTALGKEAPGTAEQAARTEDAAATLTRINAVPLDERTLDNPEWVDFLLYDNQGNVRKAHRSFILDTTHAQIVTRLPGNESLDNEGKASDLVREAAEQLSLANTSVVTTGAPVLLKDINDYLRGGMLTLGGAAVAIMVLILLLLFAVRWRLLPLLVVLVGVVWAFGLAGYVGIPLTIVTIAGLPVMLGIGIDYAIQMHARVEEEAILDRSEHPIQESARSLGPALLVVTFDAIFAFAALRFARVPMIRDFGLLLAVGIAVICLCSIVLPLAILGIREHRSPTTGKDFREGPLGRLVVFLGRVPSRLAGVFAVVSVVIFFAGIAVEDDLVLQTDPEEWVDQDSQAIQDLDEVKEEANSNSELGVFVQTDEVFSDENIEFVHEFTQEHLAGHDGALLTGSSIETAVGDLLDVPGASDIAPTGADVEAAYEVAPSDLQASTVDPDGTAMNIVFRTAPSSLEDRRPIVEDMRENTPTPEGTSLTPSGLAVVGVGLLENLEANRVELTYLAMLFVFLFLAVRLRSIVRSLLSLVPVAIAVGMASLVAWTFDLTLSPMTAVGGPLVIAACTEFTSLILLRFVEERGRGYEPRQAMDVTASRTGRAFIVSALTAISGVAVLSLSSLPLLRDFGRIVAMNVAVALLSALVILPPMLIWAEKRNLVSRGLIRKPEPYAEAPPVRYPAPAPGGS
jgi:hydrophobe/amphiphile efflux-3 (HAE3) family protein